MAIVGILFVICSVTTQAFAIEPAAIAAISSAIISGASMTGTTLTSLMQGTGFSVTCGIEVENWTKWPLSHPAFVNNGGYVSTPPRNIAPGKREAMVAHKAGGAATGTYGTVSWLIGSRKRAVIMWSVPYNQDFNSNWLGVGLSLLSRHHNWFNTMYYQSKPWFKRREYYSGILRTLVHRDDKFEVRAIMGTSHRAAVKVLVLPINDEDLAPSVKLALKRRV